MPGKPWKAQDNRSLRRVNQVKFTFFVVVAGEAPVQRSVDAGDTGELLTVERVGQERVWKVMCGKPPCHSQVGIQEVFLHPGVDNKGGLARLLTTPTRERKAGEFVG